MLFLYYVETDVAIVCLHFFESGVMRLFSSVWQAIVWKTRLHFALNNNHSALNCRWFVLKMHVSRVLKAQQTNQLTGVPVAGTLLS